MQEVECLCGCRPILPSEKERLRPWKTCLKAGHDDPSPSDPPAVGHCNLNMWRNVWFSHESEIPLTAMESLSLQRYSYEILQRMAIPYLQILRPNPIFQDDNVRPHRVRFIRLQALIEPLWDGLERVVHAKVTNTTTLVTYHKCLLKNGMPSHSSVSAGWRPAAGFYCTFVANHHLSS